MSKGTKTDVWMPLYIDDWNNDTDDLSCEEDGAYGRLIRSYWKNGAPADDDAKLARITRMDRARWKKVRPVLEPFFDIRDGHWFHGRVEGELNRASELLKKRREAGAKGGRPRKQTESKQKPNGLAKGIANGKQTETPTPTEVRAPKEALTLSDTRNLSEARHDGASDDCSKVVDLEELKRRIHEEAEVMNRERGIG